MQYLGKGDIAYKHWKFDQQLRFSWLVRARTFYLPPPFLFAFHTYSKSVPTLHSVLLEGTFLYNITFLSARFYGSKYTKFPDLITSPNSHDSTGAPCHLSFLSLSSDALCFYYAFCPIGTSVWIFDFVTYRGYRRRT
ncbi:hypothetical protein L211DRAFT_422298 [Terfezia boudieri ATCC MYA-4762]|uniref:Uncharacterized protein n=1 Tax=Terfezia boudieri ATCC MYA-4762 TaxID=1051890 RepID=A0A3N4LJC7_9PEZI|nr:hypothetical protein L211DRAFT_422298 [Terfezia boudieri ATCC MYA-4762]